MHNDMGYFEEEKLGQAYDAGLIKRLYPFTKPYRLLFICSIFMVVLITIIDLSIPYITKIAIDNYIVPQLEIKKKTGTINTDGMESGYYRANISKKSVREIVSGHKHLFKTDDASAYIKTEDLYLLSKDDIRVLRQDDLNGVSGLAVFLFAVVCLGFAFNFIQVILMEYTGQMIMHDMRLRIFSHIQDLSVSFFSKNPVGRLVTRATNDVQNMHEMFTSIVTFVFKDIFLLAGITILLISINPKLTFITFTLLPFVVFASFYFAGIARDVYRVLRIKVAEINSKFSETIEGIRIIQLFRKENENYRRFKQLNHENYIAGIKQVQVFAVFMPVIELLGSAALAIVIFYGGGSVISQNISLGSLIAFISYMKMFFRPIRDIAEKHNIMQNAMASAERIFLILDSRDIIPESVKTQLPELKQISELEFKDVSFSYMPDEPVLKNISFTIQPGESVAVVGPTGAGKTSLINLIVRFYDPTSGSVLLNNVDIREYESAIIRSKMALVMQDPFLFSGTVYDNIVFGKPDISESELENILSVSYCKSFIETLPDGIHTVLSEGVTQLSSGQRQLISMARAIAQNPDLIILDEATSYIDSGSEQIIQKALFSLMQTRTSIIIAHRLSTARNADKIMVLNKGRIIETGSHDRLMEIQGFYYKLNQFYNSK
ncbi:MAG: ABC transporter ATP-binding protein [Desulfobacterales bacterium]|nr:ABC transporter ATP-binding protein [Desulfobacterales bacterium]